MTRTLTSFFAILVLLAASAPAHAGPGDPSGPDPFTLRFDEAGNGTLSVNGGPFTTDNGYIDVNGFLAYNLPSSVFGGDVAIADPSVSCTNATNCSDGLRFLALASSPSGEAMEFYSQHGGGRLADTGFPANFNFYVGATENAAGAFNYLCTNDNCYQGLSTNAAVPEPGTLTLVGSALLGFGAIRRRRRV